MSIVSQFLTPIAHAQSTNDFTYQSALFSISDFSCAPGPTFLPCYFNALFTFAVQFAIAFAVVMVMVGGFQWLMAIGNQSKISNAKSTITGAVIGLILALTSYLLLSQINSNLVNLGLDYTNPVVIESVGGQTNCGETGSINMTELNNFVLGPMNSNQVNFAHPDLVQALKKLNDAVQQNTNFGPVQINSIIDDKILNGSCYGDLNGNKQGSCSHRNNSAHYGGTTYGCAFSKANPPVSCAVDLQYKIPFISSEHGVPSIPAWYAKLVDLAIAQGMTAFCENSNGSQLSCDSTTNHIHASVKACGVR